MNIVNVNNKYCSKYPEQMYFYVKDHNMLQFLLHNFHQTLMNFSSTSHLLSGVRGKVKRKKVKEIIYNIFEALKEDDLIFLYFKFSMKTKQQTKLLKREGK